MSDGGAEMTIAVLGPGGVGGLLAGALQRAAVPVTVVARESTARIIGERGLRVSSVSLGDFTAQEGKLASGGIELGLGAGPRPGDQGATRPQPLNQRAIGR